MQLARIWHQPDLDRQPEKPADGNGKLFSTVRGLRLANLATSSGQYGDKWNQTTALAATFEAVKG